MLFTCSFLCCKRSISINTSDVMQEQSWSTKVTSTAIFPKKSPDAANLVAEVKPPYDAPALE